MTPDWAAKPIAVPYAKFGDPQTLNLYAYVENEPVNRADADGHQDDDHKGDKTPQDRTRCGATGSELCTDNADGSAPGQVPSTQSNAKNKKPPTPAEIKAAFYKRHGKDFNAAVRKVFGKDASKVPTQTLANAPKLDTSKSRADLSAMGKGEPTEARNRGNSDTYQAQDGTIFIPKETVVSGNSNAISGDYAHELGNLLDFQINGFRNVEKNYGNPDPKTNFGDPDTGMNVEVTMFGSPQYP